MAAQRLNETIALEIIEEYALDWFQLYHPLGPDAEFDPPDWLWQAVNQKIRILRPQSLAQIIWYAKDVDLYDAQNRLDWLDHEASGRQLMRAIAKTTIMATIPIMVPVPERVLALQGE
jgi:hypothetical protein